ncbi:hypothetical protein [Bordetella genomosp. 11]|uniref:Uncharacterized protein n=1 Tax=Bordetella genomosp. 11 TaxID=1416808 RepID=A0A261UIK7_9BORD|nr:hypothetical protein [Bordetella genomosp. 11]OZI61758.1 hypothetical protein CAL28_21125 [Bordetella genomosp. 11]
MPLRPPLTHHDLARIRARYEVTPDRAPCAYQDDIVWRDIIALLHEIKRLRAMLLRAEQLRDRFPKPANCLDHVWEKFQSDLAAEPCVQELGQIKAELTAPRKRK